MEEGEVVAVGFSCGLLCERRVETKVGRAIVGAKWREEERRGGEMGEDGLSDRDSTRRLRPNVGEYKVGKKGGERERERIQFALLGWRSKINEGGKCS